ncbi:phosphoenolpyruvate carboxylase [Psychromonas sp. 14N.309.X.WAT.B.A12]|uniref:phosphoenolpyruvate carboxylase n=1 Tax=unclassified Psychromonas TaxID=2614957 RepID=UPI0025B20F71|nr:phosphoenolpyruvate carboxylase [Psychromonas sp. 14N.309.X.WAT.B.A12]MDN2665040.1 phosphoenolpyruvate carboxylase [Psychromonas sp. 14N.309.X.WAT.B.A12]
MTETYANLRGNVGLLGQLLGKSISDHLGEPFLEKIETIRQLSKSSRAGNGKDGERLIEVLSNLSDNELLPVARAFTHFLNLANIAEQFHGISRHCDSEVCAPDPLQTLIAKLKNSDVSEEQIVKSVSELKMDMVLTAHPTEITRRTLINKHTAINQCLSLLELTDISDKERDQLLVRLEQLITQAWHTNDIRKNRPTPVDEAKWGFAVIENSLWEAVPQYVRELDKTLQDGLGISLPLDASPIKFTSWMGGDRDGNPFVTAKVTKEVLITSRWVAVSLYLEDIQQLTKELSMDNCDPVLRAIVGEEADEPYRVILRKLRNELKETLTALSATLQGHDSTAKDIIVSTKQLKEPLQQCYDSLVNMGMKSIANGLLLDILRRVNCFGVNLVKLDIRQDGERHGDTLSELTRYLGIGDYNAWSEEDKQAFLLQELNSKRPLIPTAWEPSADVQEVLDTCKVVAQTDPEALGIYIISMAREASDVLAVQLLLKEVGCPFRIPVAPLFETLDDLNNAADVMKRLYAVDWYRGYIGGEQHVMIGYSDSAKDAGVMAANWAQYTSQEALIKISEDNDIQLVLFHGRGGTIGRGGAPAQQALLSQPPGSLKGGLRVTEQGEMIRFKFGLPKVAINSLDIYTAAILEANLLPPPAPKQEWRDVMQQFAEQSCEEYRYFVREEPDFVPYFRSVTPELELGKLALGSRPAKRKANGGVESLRAIPWIFAWSQNRLMLPAWLGAGTSLKTLLDEGKKEVLREMYVNWPFFHTRLEMFEMVFMKADEELTKFYEERLVPKELWPLGERLRENLKLTRETVLETIPDHKLMQEQPWIKESIKLRNPYVDPLNMLQAELLSRSRSCEQNETINPDIDQALMVTIAGIAAGLRNTG